MIRRRLRGHPPIETTQSPGSGRRVPIVLPVSLQTHGELHHDLHHSATLLCGLFAGHAGAQTLSKPTTWKCLSWSPTTPWKAPAMRHRRNHVLVTAPSAFGRDGALFAFHLTNDGLLRSASDQPSESTINWAQLLAADGNHAVSEQRDRPVLFHPQR